MVQLNLSFPISVMQLLQSALDEPPVTHSVTDNEGIPQHKKASNHHANLPLEMYSFTL